MKQISQLPRPSSRLLVVLPAMLFAQSTSATANPHESAIPVEAVVPRQLDAYNHQDAEAFVPCFSEDVVIVREGSEVVTTGRETKRMNCAALIMRQLAQ